MPAVGEGEVVVTAANRGLYREQVAINAGWSRQREHGRAGAGFRGRRLRRKQGADQLVDVHSLEGRNRTQEQRDEHKTELRHPTF